MDIPEYRINEILENSPSQGTLYVLLTIMKDNGKLNLVIRECLKAISRFPEDLHLRKILAEAYLEDGRLLEAEAEFGRVVNGMKMLAGIFRSRADIFMLQKRENEAMESLKQFLAFFPENEEAALLLTELEKTEDVFPVETPEKQEHPDILDTQEHTELEIITASLAETYFSQGKLNEAREIYEKLIEKNPEDADSRLRYEEISALMDRKQDEPNDLPAQDNIRTSKEKVISILDAWRSNIRSLADDCLTAG